MASSPARSRIDGLDTPLAALPIRWAIDLAVSVLAGDGARERQTLLLSSVADATAEALLRLETPVVVPDSRAAEANHLAAESIDRALLLFPRRSTWPSTLPLLVRTLRPGALVAVIGAGPLDAVRSRLPIGPGLAPPGTLAPGTVASALHLQAVASWRLCGLRSSTIAALRVAASRFGRPDLADRLESAYQQALVEPGSPRLWTVGVWIGRR